MKKFIVLLLGVILVGVIVPVFLQFSGTSVSDVVGSAGRTGDLPFINYTETFDQDEEAYFVYFWQETCSFCMQFEPYLLEAFNDYDLPIYVVDLADASNQSAWYDWERHHELHSIMVGRVVDDEWVFDAGHTREMYPEEDGWAIEVVDDDYLRARPAAIHNENPTDYSEINIIGTPTLFLVRNGEIADYAFGIESGRDLLNMLK